MYHTVYEQCSTVFGFDPPMHAEFFMLQLTCILFVTVVHHINGDYIITDVVSTDYYHFTAYSIMKQIGALINYDFTVFAHSSLGTYNKLFLYFVHNIELPT